jgi:hypothetical protein
MFRDEVIRRLKTEFGHPARTVTKVTAFDVTPTLGVVVQTDAPNREDAAFVWLPYPPDNQPVPDIALEYAGESGRHSNTYPSPGLERGKPALKLILRRSEELDDVVSYIKAFKDMAPLPAVRSASTPGSSKAPSTSTSTADAGGLIPVDVTAMPIAPPPKPRREAIPRAVQREVWQRDGGRCVECGSKEKLCFDHIVPFSRGGSNSVRNLQLLCEPCNLSKSNRI